MRLDKFLSDALNIPRAAAKKAVSSGRVTVNGTIIKDSGHHVEEAAVALDGQPVRYQRYCYIMLHKPAGCVCANSDRCDKTVFDLLPPEYRKKDLFVCGRLDKDTTGLVLLTNNGPLAHRLLAPKSNLFKEYLVTLRDPVTEEVVLELQRGVALKDLRCRPAYFEPLSANRGILRISEGKYHQIKRMFAALGNQVTALHRQSIHGLLLDPALPEGACRYLTNDEIISLEKKE